LDFGVHTLRNGEQPYDLIGQARRIVFRLIEQHQPDVVAIEKPYRIATGNGPVLQIIAKELHERARDLGLAVREHTPEEVRKAIAGNEKATKYRVAQILAEKRFPELANLAPRKPKVPALWLVSRDRYWLHMFDALAMAIAASIQVPPPSA
jgi:hypothetical protein